MMSPNIYSWIKSEENKYETDEVQIGDNWRRNMRNLVQMIFHLKHGVFYKGENDWMRVFKNIMFPIIDLCNWTEDIELKQIVFFIENKTEKVLSFMIKKYHEDVYAKKNNIDEMIDEVIDSDNTYGGSLVQDTGEPRPKVVPLTSIAFCNQTNILGAPIGFKKVYSLEELREMKSCGWGEKSNGATISIEELIALANSTSTPAGGKTDNQNSGKVVEVYIVKGSLPEHYLLDNNNMEDSTNQLQIVAFYTTKDSKKEGVTLYRKKEKEGKLLFNATTPIDGFALGYGVGERILHNQIWTNFLEIHKMNMIEASSKIILFSDDDAFSNKEKIRDMDNLEIAKISPDSKWGVRPIQTGASSNIAIFVNSVNDLYSHAQLQGAAFDPIMGEQPTSGTTFRGQERTVQQGKGSHEKKRGKRAKFIEEIYRKIIIPKMVKEITSGKEFIATLDAEEMSWVSEQLANNKASRMANELVLNGELPPNGMTFDEYKEQQKQKFLQSFSKKGNRHLLEIIKGEMKDIADRIGINIVGKQKDLFGLSEKLLSIFKTIFANPTAFQQAMQIPALAKAFDNILEFGGMNPADFASLMKMPALTAIPSPMQQEQQVSPELSELAPTNV